MFYTYSSSSLSYSFYNFAAALFKGFILCYILGFCQQHRIKADRTEALLIQKLLRNYVNGRPSENSLHPLNVTVGLALNQIIDVDERNQILTTNCRIYQMWTDHKLQWNYSDFDGIDIIHLPGDLVWKPDIILYNNADSQYKTAIVSTNAVVGFHGNIVWHSSAIFKSTCEINVSWFPFDEQVCAMKLASWTYDGHELNLNIASTKGDLSNYVENGEWDLIEVTGQKNVVHYSCCPEPYPDVTYSVRLMRRPRFYVFNLILPCVLITGMALLSFYIPSDSGEKATLGVTTLLSMTVFLITVMSSMPPTSNTVPLIGIYYGATISLVSLTTSLSIFTLNLHHRGCWGPPVPPLLRKIVLGWMARILLFKFRPISPNRMEKSQTSKPVDSSVLSSTSDKENNVEITEDLNCSKTPQILLNPLEIKTLFLIKAICHGFEQFENKSSFRNNQEMIKEEWQRVALVIDRFLLYIFIFLAIGATFGTLTMSPYTRLY